MSILFYCEHCNNKFNNIASLNKHQKITKYCLVIQGKIEDTKKKKEEEKERIEREKEKERERIRKEKEEEKERIEREKERVRKEKEEEKERIEREKEKKKADKFRCEYCKVKFSSKNSLFGHLDICLDKYKKIIEDKEKEKEKIIEENKIEKEKIIEENKIEKKKIIEEKENEKEKIIEEKEKEKEKIIEEYKQILVDMKNKWRVKKEKFRKAGSRINIRNNNNTTINNINQTVKIVLQSIDLSEENIKKICSHYGREDFLRGSIGAARFIQKNIMSTKGGDPTAVCTDIARKMFYVNINGKQIKDPSLHIFYSKIDSYMKKEYYRVYIEENECIRGERRSSEEITEDRYRDILNRNKVMKRLAEMAYVQSSKLQITQE